MLLALVLSAAVPDDPGKYLNRTAASWAGDLSHADARDRRAAAFALSRLGASAVPHLPALLRVLQNDKEAAVRVAAVTALADLGALAAGSVVPALSRAAEKDADLAVRRMAVQGLGRLGDRAGAAEPVLTKCLGESDAVLRQYSAAALGQLGKAAVPAVPTLVTLAKDPDAAVRREVLAAMGNLGSEAEEGLPVLTNGLTDEDSRVREAAILALRRWGPLAFPAAGNLLIVAENRMNSPASRRESLLTLEQIWPTGPKATGLWDRLVHLADHDPAAEVRQRAREAVKKIGPRRRE